MPYYSHSEPGGGIDATSDAKTAARVLDPIPREQLASITIDDATQHIHCRFFAFDTSVVIELGPHPHLDTGIALAGQLIAMCREYERLFSRTLPHSDVSRINRAHGEWVRIDPRTADLIGEAVHYCTQSEGTFDITIGTLCRLWNWKAQQVPHSTEIAQALRHVNYRAIEMSYGYSAGQTGGDNSNGSSNDDEAWCRLRDPQAAIDLGGIAKGWIADRLCETIQFAGYEHFLIDLGGNTVLHGRPADQQPWNIGIPNPLDTGRSIATLQLTDVSIVTSGIYERRFTADNITYHHIIDPHTGYPARTNLISATIIARTSLDAEGYSTTVLAVGAHRAARFIAAHPAILGALLIRDDDTLLRFGIG